MQFTTSDTDANFVVSGNQDIASGNNILIQSIDNLFGFYQSNKIIMT